MSLVELVDIERVYAGTPPVRALDGVSLSIGEAELVSIMGPSGSGKSTLLNVLGLLDTPTAGIFRFAGEDVRAFDERRRTRFRAQHLGFVFQSFHLLARRTATENVELGMTIQGEPVRHRRQAARAALQAVGLGHRLDADVGTLSGGEQQRVAIARALARRPSLLLCDEPTGALDSRTTRDVLDVLRTANAGGVTIAVVTHDAAAAACASRTIHLRDGRVASS